MPTDKLLLINPQVCACYVVRNTFNIWGGIQWVLLLFKADEVLICYARSKSGGWE